MIKKLSIIIGLIVAFVVVGITLTIKEKKAEQALRYAIQQQIIIKTMLQTISISTLSSYIHRAISTGIAIPNSPPPSIHFTPFSLAAGRI